MRLVATIPIKIESTAWSDEDVLTLREAYTNIKAGEQLGLDALAKRLGRHKTNVCRKARAMGLTNINRPKVLQPKLKMGPVFGSTEELRAAVSKRMRNHHATVGHPKGMLGKSHTPEVKERLRMTSKAAWLAKSTKEISERNLKSAKTRDANMRAGVYSNERSGCTWKAGWREIGGKRKYYRSRWEANYARYLEWLKTKGQIDEWDHEPETFWFDGIKRGSVSYLPDFRVIENNGNIAYHEVKGWMDARSKTKIRRMAKYHPAVTLVVIKEKQYNEIKAKLSTLIPGWES